MSLVLIACVGRMPQWSLRHRLSILLLAVFAYLPSSTARPGSIPCSAALPPGSSVDLCAFVLFCVVLLRARRGEARYLAAAAPRRQRRLRPHQHRRLLSQAALLRLYPGDGRGPGMLLCQPQHGLRVDIRVTGIFGNANVLAGFLALSVSPLYLNRTAAPPGPSGRLYPPFVNSLSFLLAFSMGAIGIFAVAVLFYLLAERKGSASALPPDGGDRPAKERPSGGHGGCLHQEEEREAEPLPFSQKIERHRDLETCRWRPC